MRYDEGSRNGSLSMRSKHKSHGPNHFPTDPHKESSTNKTHCGCQRVLSQCMACCISPMELKPRDQYGQLGHS